MAYLRGQSSGLQQDTIGACAHPDPGWTLTWWRKPAEPREGSVCLTRTAADGQIWALYQQTELFLQGRSEEGLRVPGNKSKEPSEGRQPPP